MKEEYGYDANYNVIRTPYDEKRNKAYENGDRETFLKFRDLASNWANNYLRNHPEIVMDEER